MKRARTQLTLIRKIT